MSRILAAVLAVFLFVSPAFGRGDCLSVADTTAQMESAGLTLHVHLEQDEAQAFTDWVAEKNGVDSAPVGAVQIWGQGAIGFVVVYDTARCVGGVVDGQLASWQGLVEEWRASR